jgi:acyl dehydratase
MVYHRASRFAGLADLGSMPDEHRFPDSARGTPIGSTTQHVDEQVARRYAEVSGDWSAHHFDIDAARASGFDFVFSHGLCTMAMCSHRLLGLVGVSDPGRVRRVAVRFAFPTRLGGDLTVSVFGVKDGSFAFEATCAGANVITHGRLELRS